MSTVAIRRVTNLVDGIASTAVACANLADAAIHLLSAPARAVLKAIRAASEAAPKIIAPLRAVRAQARTYAERVQQLVTTHPLPAHEAYIVTQLATIEQSGYRLDDANALQPHLAKLSAATSLTEAQGVMTGMTATLDNEHRIVLQNRLTLACEKAALATGFRRLETTTSPLGAIRVIARDEQGRAIVTEINGVAEDEPRIESEVVGVTDNSCQGILERFDQALKQQGVRSTPPKTTSTGGIPQLRAAKEFAKNKLSRPMRKRRTQAQTVNHR